MIGAKPFAQFKFKDVANTTMAYIDEGVGDAVVFQHGNPTSSYLWRNIMPHVEGLGRLVACDLVGMGASEKLDASGPDSYHYHQHREHLFALWDALDLGDRVIFVVHDWGSALAFDWANQHRDRVAGIVYMEAMVTPLRWSDFPPPADDMFRGFRSPDGERIVLQDNMFVEGILPNSILRELTEEEMSYYRRPYRHAGEDRRPTLSWPRDIPIDGEPAPIASIVGNYSEWLAHSDVPKLFINAEPGAMITGRVREYVRTWPNQTEISVPGSHFVQEDSPDLIGAAVAEFVQRIRTNTRQKNLGTPAP